LNQVMSMFHDKRFKQDYLQLQHQVISELTALSLELKKVEPQKRKDHLVTQLEKVNSFIEQNVRAKILSSDSQLS
jgi:ABC-type hemin transport system substrate-binding protein